jgi:long-subunit acyl-CoA synthetase (AMP-forming)
MKRAVLCVPNPQDYIDQLDDYSIMIINPAVAESRRNYLLANSDYSLLITEFEIEQRMGADYPNERLLWYTSGTTGDSKFCSFTQAQLDRLSDTIINAYQLTNNDRYVSIMPLWHAHGQGFYWATKRAQCETNFLTVKNIKHMPEYSPTFITAIPDVLGAISQVNFDSLRFVRSASAPLSNELYTKLSDKYRVPVIEAFGMTEALSHCFTNPLDGEQRIGTVGLPSGVDADIVDGQLYIRGPSVVQQGWINTGDLAERDSKGYYRILGRHRDQINVRGMKLNPVSLETQIRAAIPEIEECVVFGNDTVKCLYKGDCDPQLIKRFLLSLGSQCRPTVLQQVDSIPISPSGKLSRSWLNQNF